MPKIDLFDINQKSGSLMVEYSIEIQTEPDDSSLFKDEIELVDNLLLEGKHRIKGVEDTIASLTADLSAADYVMSIASGILAGCLDAVFVGEFSLDRGTEWGKEKVDGFVCWVAKKQGYEGDNLTGAVSFLEKNNPVAADLVTNNFGGGRFHHLNDFSHHPTPVGLFFSMLTQFTGRVYGTKASSLMTVDSPEPQGAFVSYPVPNGELIGNSLTSKISLGFIKWLFHMVSDMAGSSSSIYMGKYGTGLPGPVVSLLKELSSLPVFQDKDNINTFSKWISKLFNGTLLAEHDAEGRIIPESVLKFDLRAEIGVGYEIGRQTLPIVLNECIVRSYYMVSRLIRSIRGVELKSWKDYNKIYTFPWKNILPKASNRTLVRMLTISTGTFTAIDIADATIRALVLSGANPGNFAKQLLLRVNIVGVGRFSMAVYADAKMGYDRWKEVKHLQSMLSSQQALTNAQLYYKQGELQIAEIDATKAADTLVNLVGDSVPAVIESMADIYKSHKEIERGLMDIQKTNPQIINEIQQYIS
ncbi:MAG: hypothetical protein ACI382_05715 [Alloprevotella sp.]